MYNLQFTKKLKNYTLYIIHSTFQRGFTRTELLGVLAITMVIILVMLSNFQTSRVKGQDEQRKANLSLVVRGLEEYHADFGRFPQSSPDGRILACGSSEDVKPCSWGFDKLKDLTDPNYPSYLDPIPLDPKQGQGFSFFYLSRGSDFQVFAHLEREQDPARNLEIEKWNLVCGSFICNYGITTSGHPIKQLLK